MDYYSDTIDDGRGGICEDAPCCGCCGTNLYGERQGDDSGMDKGDYIDLMMRDDYDDDLGFGDHY